MDGQEKQMPLPAAVLTKAFRFHPKALPQALVVVHGRFFWPQTFGTLNIGSFPHETHKFENPVRWDSTWNLQLYAGSVFYLHGQEGRKYAGNFSNSFAVSSSFFPSRSGFGLVQTSTLWLRCNLQYKVSNQHAQSSALMSYR